MAELRRREAERSVQESGAKMSQRHTASAHAAMQALIVPVAEALDRFDPGRFNLSDLAGFQLLTLVGQGPSTLSHLASMEQVVRGMTIDGAHRSVGISFTVAKLVQVA